MPFLAELKHRKPFKPRSDLERRLEDISIVLDALLPLEIHVSTKRKMIDRALWRVVEVSGNFSPRYRSEGVLCNLRAKIQRDHVHPRALLVREFLNKQRSAEDTVKLAFCCLVTDDEHQRLTDIDSKYIGWARYEQAEVKYQDMLPRPTPDVA